MQNNISEAIIYSQQELAPYVNEKVCFLNLFFCYLIKIAHKC